MPRGIRAPLEVVMIPLAEKRVINPPAFAPFPRLYLELMENKEKIKKEFVKQEFIPKYDTEISFDEDGDMRETKLNQPAAKASSKDASKSSTKAPDVKAASKAPAVKAASKTPAVKAASKAPAVKDKPKSSQPPDDPFDELVPPPEPDGPPDAPPDAPPEPNVLADDITEEKKDDDPLASFLKKSRSVGHRPPGSTEEKQKAYQEKKDDVLRDDRKMPPSLADLEDGGAFDTGGIKNMDRISKREQDQEQKVREYLFKYDLLRKSYPNEEIPKFTINSDPEFIAKSYDDILRNLSVSDNISKYKKYLLFGFFGVEALAGNILGLDMKGFTKQQIVEMSSYDKLLIEIGEKNYTPKSSWPVELRLLGLIVMNAAFFIASKMAMRATGTDILGQLNASANAGVQASNAIAAKKKQKMSGPTVNLDDIPFSEPAPATSADGVQFVQKK